MDWELAAFVTEAPHLKITKKKKKISKKELKHHILQSDTCNRGTVVEFSTPHSSCP